MVAIEGMEMPSCCEECEYTPKYCSYCLRLHQPIPKDIFNTSRPSHCPLTEIEERKVGKWIVKDGRERGYDIAGIKTWYIQIMCNKCGFIKTAIEGHTGQYNFCPNCGAEMRGDEND